jgi:hypothetical protein
MQDSGSHREPWFEQAGGWGTTMPLARDSPSIGGCPWPRPRQGSPYQGDRPGGARLSGQPAGVSLASARSATRSAAAPRAGVPGPQLTSGVPRETRQTAQTGSPAAPGSRHRGSVGGHPRYGDRAADPPVPSDSPSLGTHGGARRPALCVSTSARSALAPCAPFWLGVPIWGRPYAQRERMPSSVLHTAGQPRCDRVRTVGQ